MMKLNRQILQDLLIRSEGPESILSNIKNICFAEIIALNKRESLFLYS